MNKRTILPFNNIYFSNSGKKHKKEEYNMYFFMGNTLK